MTSGLPLLMLVVVAATLLASTTGTDADWVVNWLAPGQASYVELPVVGTTAW